MSTANDLVAELIDRVFDDRDEAHREHWNTRSYAAHMALGDFYGAVIDKVDAFVEAFQGQFGLIGRAEVEEPEDDEQKTIIACLRDTSDWISTNMDAIALKDQTLMNLLQDLSGTYLTALYKLENLR